MELEELEKITSLLSPEGVIMLPIAILLDIFGIVCLVLNLAFGIGEAISYIPDIMGLVIFGLWILIRTQSKEITDVFGKEVGEKVVERRMEIKGRVEKIRGMEKTAEKAAEKAVAKVAVKKGLGTGAKFVLSFLGELAPFIGALPFWSLMVYSELTRG